MRYAKAHAAVNGYELDWLCLRDDLLVSIREILRLAGL